jgi:hypothetical protein
VRPATRVSRVGVEPQRRGREGRAQAGAALVVTSWAVAWLVGCATPSAARPLPARSDAGAIALSSPEAPAGQRSPTASPSESPAPSASSSFLAGSGSPVADAESSPIADDPQKRTRPPDTSDDLETRARHLLDAIAQNEPKLADDFFFPRAPFLPLKDVQDPGRYFDQLLATYHRDISALHASRKNWSDVTIVSFALGTPPGWVAPGKEYNKIGYFRSFHAKLRYRGRGDAGSDARTSDIAVATLISWAGRWYVTHLGPIHH